MKKIILLCCLLPAMCFADQQYIAGDENVAANTNQNVSAQVNQAQTNVNDSAQTSTGNLYGGQAQNDNKNTDQIYVAPTNTVAQNNIYSQPSSNSNSNSNVNTNATQNPAPPSPQPPQVSNANQTPVTTAPASTTANVSAGYTDAAKQAWFKSCVSAIANKSQSPEVNSFCSCGWQHISSGELPANLLLSTDANDIQKRNLAMKAITQECIVEMMANQGNKS